jgi:hypothetical protein
LEYGARLHVNEILYVLGLKKNLLSVATLEEKGYWVIFKDMKALLWAKGSQLSKTKPIGTHSGGLYVMSGQSVQALAHDATSSTELWHIMTWTSSLQIFSRFTKHGMWHALYFT